MTLLALVLVGIALLLIVGLVSFYLGVRYSARLMPTALARLDEEELNALADKTAQERARLQR